MDQISMLKNSFDVGFIDGNFEFDPSKNGNSDSMENGHKNRVLRYFKNV